MAASTKGFFKAAWDGKLDQLKTLIEANANVNTPSQDFENWTVLHIAADANNLTMIKYLLGAKADVFAKEDDGMVPRELASTQEVINFLKEAEKEGKHSHAKDKGSSNVETKKIPDGKEAGSLIRLDMDDDVSVAKTIDLKVPVQFCAAGNGHAAVISNKGDLFLWGLNADSQLGVDTNGKPAKGPMPVAIPFTDKDKLGSVIHVACGTNHTLAAVSDGTLWSWGSGKMGKLGHGNEATKRIPTRVSLHGIQLPCGKEYREEGDGIGKENTMICTFVACSESASAALFKQKETEKKGQNGTSRKGSTLFTWGNNRSGILGLGDTIPHFRPAGVDFKKLSLKKYDRDDIVTDVSMGNNHAAAVLEDGMISTWGQGDFGQLGYQIGEDNEDDLQLTPRIVNPKTFPDDFESEDAILSVSCGPSHTSCISKCGSIYSWGAGETQQLGIEDTDDVFEPVKVDSSVSFVQLSVGSTATAAITSSGKVYMWGFEVGETAPQLSRTLEPYTIKHGAVGSGNAPTIFTY